MAELREKMENDMQDINNETFNRSGLSQALAGEEKSG